MKRLIHHNQMEHDLTSAIARLIKNHKQIEQIRSLYENKRYYLENKRDRHISHYIDECEKNHNKIVAYMNKLNRKIITLKNVSVRLVNSCPRIKIVIPELAFESAKKEGLIRLIPSDEIIDMDAIDMYFKNTNTVLSGFELVPSISKIEIINRVTKKK